MYYKPGAHIDVRLTITPHRLLTLLRNLTTAFLILLAGIAMSAMGIAQQPDKGQGELTQGVLKIPVEEVRIPVFATDDRGRFDTQLSVDDLLIREDGIAQKIRGVYRLPAYVVLLADTGGEVNPLKSVRLTANVATEFVDKLRSEDSIAVMQVNNHVELISDWTQNRAETVKKIRTKLLPAKRSALVEGLMLAADKLRNVPAGNRHLVIISDGLDPKFRLDEIMHNLAGSAIAVHVISYTSLKGVFTQKSVSRPREKSSVPQELIDSWPHTHDPRNPTVYDMKDIVQAKGGVTIDVERIFRRGGAPKKEIEKRVLEFDQLAEATGGVAWFPEDASEMLLKAGDAARDIDSQYVVTYKPQRSFAEAPVGEYRKLDVISRRIGLRVRSRRGYVVNPGRP
ncbi:MAG TPA: VWA domain-containing protein [Pyrinomonadaceae bacterium]|jgi:VWFA-related protein|nr:VWA domain-containing protein [Pyrinomonadaceae bacterium]